jgi:hypothetical protein
MPEPEPPPRLDAAPRPNHLPWVILFLTFAVTALALFFFDPEKVSIFPACQFHALTGLDCPGCGGLRAVNRLLHGHLGEAFRLNPMLFVLGPLIAGWLGWYFHQRRKHPGRDVGLPKGAVYAVVAGIILFGILRNLLPWLRGVSPP